MDSLTPEMLKQYYQESFIPFSTITHIKNYTSEALQVILQTALECALKINMSREWEVISLCGIDATDTVVQANLTQLLKQRSQLIKTGKNAAVVDLSGGNLSCINWEGLNLTGVIGDRAIFNEACLNNANMENVSLYGAHMFDIQLNHAILTGANLTNAEMTFANLNGANLQGANLTDTNFRKANLSGANLRDIKISDDTSFQDAYYNQYTQFPDGFVPQNHGLIYKAS